MTAAVPRLPDAFLAGVPKAGTSTLARWLGDHPGVYLPPEKEIHFFDQQAEAGLEWYRRQFVGPGTVALDATPSYALRDQWLAAAARAVPRARFLVLLRHPVDRLWSGYWYRRSMGVEVRSLREVVDAGIAAGEHRPTPVRAGDYRALLDRLDRHLDRNRLLLLLQDDLADEPDVVWSRSCSFLGLDPRPRPAHVGERLNTTVELRSFWLRYWSMRLHLFRRVPRVAHALDRWNRTDRRPPPMPADLRARLLEHYEPSVLAVERRLGRSLPSWRE